MKVALVRSCFPAQAPYKRKGISPFLSETDLQPRRIATAFQEFTRKQGWRTILTLKILLW